MCARARTLLCDHILVPNGTEFCWLCIEYVPRHYIALDCLYWRHFIFPSWCWSANRKRHAEKIIIMCDFEHYCIKICWSCAEKTKFKSWNTTCNMVTSMKVFVDGKDKCHVMSSGAANSVEIEIFVPTEKNSKIFRYIILHFYNIFEVN